MTHPTAVELLQAVMAWLDDVTKRGNADHSARDDFLALVARNALGIVVRELQLGAAAEAAAVARLQALLGSSGDVAALETELCDRIRSGGIECGDAALLAHLRLSTAARLAIDQPRYVSSA